MDTPVQVEGNYQNKWIKWTECNEKDLSATKSKGRKHLRKGVEDDDVFLLQIKETFNDYVTKNHELLHIYPC